MSEETTTEPPKKTAKKTAKKTVKKTPTEAPKEPPKKPPKKPPKESPKVDIPAPKLIAFIGCLVMICEGIAYLGTRSFVPLWNAMFIITGIVNLAAGILLFLVINVVELNLDLKIPYKWWLLLAIGGGVLAMDFIMSAVVFGAIFGTGILYWGGLLVALGGMIEWKYIPEKLDISDSKFVLLVGSGMAIAVSLITIILFPVPANIIWAIVAIGLCTLLIMAIFDIAIQYEWWLTLGVGIAIFMLIHAPSGVVLLAGYLLVQLDY